MKRELGLDAASLRAARDRLERVGAIVSRGMTLPAERTHVVESLDEVTATLARIAGPGDVALFANDLPDPYLALKK